MRTVALMDLAIMPNTSPSFGKANMVGTSSSSRFGEYWNSLQGSHPLVQAHTIKCTHRLYAASDA